MLQIVGWSLIFWGMFVTYSSIFCLQKKDFYDDNPLGRSGYIEWEVLMKFMNRLPHPFVKVAVVIIGSSLIVLGTFIL
jgi:hypothetical protein